MLGRFDDLPIRFLRQCQHAHSQASIRVYLVRRRDGGQAEELSVTLHSVVPPSTHGKGVRNNMVAVDKWPAPSSAFTFMADGTRLGTGCATLPCVSFSQPSARNALQERGICTRPAALLSLSLAISCLGTTHRPHPRKEARSPLQQSLGSAASVVPNRRALRTVQ